MAEAVLKVEKRELKKKSYLKQLRKDEKIPGIFYTQGKESVPIIFNNREFRQLLSQHVNLFDLDFGKGKKIPSILREIQYDPIIGSIVHIDFLGVDITEKIVVRIPLNFTGVPIGQKEQGGIIEHPTREVEITCLPKDMPTSIDVDISHLQINQSIHVRDIKLENIEIITDPEIMLVHVVPPKVEKEVVPTEGEVEGEVIAEPEVITARAEEKEEE